FRRVLFRSQPRLARELPVEAGHDPEHGRLAGAVGTEDADLGVRVEGEMDVLQHLLRPVGLGQTGHVVDELACHGARRTPLRSFREAEGRGVCRRKPAPGQCARWWLAGAPASPAGGTGPELYRAFRDKADGCVKV